MRVQLPSGKSVKFPVCRPVFREWKGTPLPNTFLGHKPLLDYKDKPEFAELAILDILTSDGWNGCFVSAYGGTHYFIDMPEVGNSKLDPVSLPAERQLFLKEIWRTAETTACFDIFAWKDDDIIFCEAKQKGKDHLTDAQLKFIDGAIACGVPAKCLILVEWSFEN